METVDGIWFDFEKIYDTYFILDDKEYIGMIILKSYNGNIISNDILYRININGKIEYSYQLEYFGYCSNKLGISIYPNSGSVQFSGNDKFIVMDYITNTIISEIKPDDILSEFFNPINVNLTLCNIVFLNETSFIINCYDYYILCKFEIDSSRYFKIIEHINISLPLCKDPFSEHVLLLHNYILFFTNFSTINIGIINPVNDTFIIVKSFSNIVGFDIIKLSENICIFKNAIDFKYYMISIYSNDEIILNEISELCYETHYNNSEKLKFKMPEIILKRFENQITNCLNGILINVLHNIIYQYML